MLLFGFTVILTCFTLCYAVDFTGLRKPLQDELSSNCHKDLTGIDADTLTENYCKCREDKPHFHVFDNTTYGCGTAADICKACNGTGYATIDKTSATKSLVLTIPRLEETADVNICNHTDRRLMFSIFYQHDSIELFTKGFDSYKLDSTKTKIRVNITDIPFNLTGRLALIKLWCINRNTSGAMVTSPFMVKFVGHFSYPDTQEYYLLTTPTVSTTTTPTPATKSSSKNLVFYVVIPVAAFLILVAILIICISKRLQQREKNRKESTKKLQDSTLSIHEKDVGINNPAYTTNTLLKTDKVDGTTEKARNNNHSTKTNKSNDIKIYTVVDLTPIAQQPVPPQQSQPEGIAFQTTIPRRRSQVVSESNDSVTLSDVPDGDGENAKKYSMFSNTSSASDITVSDKTSVTEDDENLRQEQEELRQKEEKLRQEEEQERQEKEKLRQEEEKQRQEEEKQRQEEEKLRREEEEKRLEESEKIIKECEEEYENEKKRLEYEGTLKKSENAMFELFKKDMKKNEMSESKSNI